MTRLFVGNLSFEVTPVDVRALFATYGPVGSADIVIDRSNGKSIGFRLHRDGVAGSRGGCDSGAGRHRPQRRSINVSRARPRNDGGSRGNPPRGWEVVGEGRDRW